MTQFEAFGGPLDGAIINALGSTYPAKSGGVLAGFYKPPEAGTEVKNADGLPLWHWYALEK